MTLKKTNLPEVLFSLAIFSRAEFTYIISEIVAAADYQMAVWHDLEEVENVGYIYFEKLSEAQVAALDIASRLEACRDFIQDYDIRVIKVLKDEWTQTWKKFIQVSEIGKNLVIKPKWQDYSPKINQCVIEIDTEMSFGTGRHGTTVACLTFLEELLANPNNSSKSLLDIGCGSGILSIAAKKLGVDKVTGFDLFIDAVEVAQQNSALNDVDINLFAADLFQFQADQQYDIVIANVLCQILIEQVVTIVKSVKKGGKLIIAGILENQYPECLEEFLKHGVLELNNITIDGWKSGVFEKCN